MFLRDCGSGPLSCHRVGRPAGYTVRELHVWQHRLSPGAEVPDTKLWRMSSRSTMLTGPRNRRLHSTGVAQSLRTGRFVRWLCENSNRLPHRAEKLLPPPDPLDPPRILRPAGLPKERRNAPVPWLSRILVSGGDQEGGRSQAALRGPDSVVPKDDDTFVKHAKGSGIDG
jgi:hypothetical protein